MSNRKRIKITIDGKEIETYEGTLIIKAAEDAGIYIPRLCYHEALKPDGNCRMCFVEIEGLRKPVPSCLTPAKEGMVIRTDTDALKKHRSSILEMILTTHPMDCPICDQAGECALQDYYFQYDLKESRWREKKEKKPKRVHWGKNLIYDAARCIICKRCVRFLDEITGTQELGVFERGIHSYIGLFDGNRIENDYSGNLVDICPVGAITDLDFRFKSRVWFLNRTPSICPFCARGCNIEIHTNTKNPFSSQRVYRIKPRKNLEVNKWWICDEGRYSYEFIDSDRIEYPMARGKKTSWDSVRQEILKIVGKDVRLYVSAWMSNEELTYWMQIAKTFDWKLSLVGKPRGKGDEILKLPDKNPNRKGAEILGIREEIGHEEVAVVFHFLPVSLERHKIKIGIFTNKFEGMDKFDIIIPAAVFAEKEGSWTNFQGKVQNFQKALEPIGEAKSEGEIGEFLANTLGLDLQWEIGKYREEFEKELRKWNG